MTKKREIVYNIIRNSSVPLTAADIYKQIIVPMDPATVYRTLHYLEKRKKIRFFYFTCQARGGEHYYYEEQSPHIHFFHCHVCHTFISLGKCDVKKMENDLEKIHGIKIDKHILYFTGYCKTCVPSSVKQI